MGKVLTFLTASLSLGLAATALAQTPPDMFKDVDKSHWAYEATESLRSKGIVVGYPDGYFRGKRTLTRYEFAVALDRALKTIVSTEKVGPAGPPGPAGGQGERGAQGEAGPVGPPGVTPEELATLRRLTQEFRDELASLGNNIAAINRRLDAMARDIADIKAQLARMPKLSGGAFFGIRSDNVNGFYVDKDGRISPLGGLQDVVHSYRVALDANIPGGATLTAAAIWDNHKNSTAGTDSRVISNAGLSSFVPGDARLDQLEIRTPFGGLGRGSHLTLGRFAHRISHLTLWKPDNDTYFNIPWVDDGAYRMDGVKLNTNFGSVSLEAFAAQTSSVQGSDGLGPVNNPIAGSLGGPLFGNAGLGGPGSKPIGQNLLGVGGGFVVSTQGSSSVDQLAGISLGLGVHQLKGGHIAVHALGTGTGASSPFGPNVYILGAEGEIGIMDRLNLNVDWGKTMTFVGRSTVFPSSGAGNHQNNAFNANLGWKSGGLSVTAGYRYVDPLFYAPGYWGRIGNWINPTNIQGPTFRAAYDFSRAFGVNLGGDFFTGARNRQGLGGIGTDDDIHRVLVGLRWDVSKNFRITTDWEGVYWTLDETGGRPAHSGIPNLSGGIAHPTEQYITFGTGYNLTNNTALKLMYQIGDFNGHGTITDGGAFRNNFGVFTSQVAVKF